MFTLFESFDFGRGFLFFFLYCSVRNYVTLLYLLVSMEFTMNWTIRRGQVEANDVGRDVDRRFLTIHRQIDNALKTGRRCNFRTLHDFTMNFLSSFDLPPILLDVPRNAVLAIGMPLVLGSLSGYPTSKVVNGPWYKVSTYDTDTNAMSDYCL